MFWWVEGWETWPRWRIYAAVYGTALFFIAPGVIALAVAPNLVTLSITALLWAMWCKLRHVVEEALALREGREVVADLLAERRWLVAEDVGRGEL